MIAWKETWAKEEKVFKLQLMSFEEKTGTELTKYPNLKAILKYLEHKDVMPITLHIKQIKNFYTLVQFLLVPFKSLKPFGFKIYNF